MEQRQPPFRPYVQPPPKLPQIAQASSCQHKIVGKCSDHGCRGEHGIRRLDDERPAQTPINALIRVARGPHRGESCFDNNRYHPDGPRHDNDHDVIEKITILPTTDEIICLKLVFMPAKNATASPAELLDIYFRHLRYESIETIIDSCYDAIQQVLWKQPSTAHLRETPQRLRYTLLQDVKFESAEFSLDAGAVFKLSFECPPALRGFALLKSNVLEKQKLCSLIAIHGDNGEVNVVHFEVKERAPTHAPGFPSRSRASVQVTMADRDDISKVRQATYYCKKLINARFFIVNVPNVLPASFVPVLKRLQSCHKAGTFPFAEFIAPGAYAVTTGPPAYSMDSEFKYNVSCLKKPDQDMSMDKLLFRPMKSEEPDPEILHNLKTYTTLDEGQAVALYENLSRSIAFTQGPPGTGKTFLGVAEAEVLLSSPLQSLSGQKTKPLVVICMTNHALDDFILELVARGMKDVIRLGGQSRSEEIARYHIQKFLNTRKLPPQDWQMKRRFGRDNDDIHSLAQEWAEELTNGTAFRLLQDFLRINDPDILSEFERLDASSDIKNDIKFLTRSSAGYTFRYWLNGGDLDSLAALLGERFGSTANMPERGRSNYSASILRLRTLSLSSRDAAESRSEFELSYPGLIPANDLAEQEDELGDIKKVWARKIADIKATKIKPVHDLPTIQRALSEFAERCKQNEKTHKLWALSLQDRQSLFETWCKEIDQFALCEAFAEIHRRHQEHQTTRWNWNQANNARLVLNSATQIIGLTATGAARHWQFLNALQPETYIIEEASELTEPITIAGLVPSIQHLIKIGDPLQLRPQVAVQVLCSEFEPRYRLDESLFERLMHQMPYSRLNVQRRAHPEMAQLLRYGDYPYLIDHPKTSLHPSVPGFMHRIFWMTHDRSEDQPDPGSPLAKSFSNAWEVRFICEAVKYLVQQQDYSMKRITILTPYNGQVASFAKVLGGFCKVVLNDEDKQSLVDAGMLSDKDIACQNSPSTKVSLSALIRVTSIDNYQGEENDVVFLSTVRSNHNNKTGFLANQNRINVAISRARNGFYIIGNAALLADNVPGWNRIIQGLSENGRIGPHLPLSPCVKHALTTDVVVDIHHPDFSKIPKCAGNCGEVLPCGHNCQSVCHGQEMHTDGRIKCIHPCDKVLDCGHTCTKTCSEACGPCKMPIQPVVLACGHKSDVQCSTDVGSIQCQVIMAAFAGTCGHFRFKRCCNGITPCQEPCLKLRPCSHSCRKTCSACGPAESSHGHCEQVCGKVMDCGHQCRSRCHYGQESCPPCQQSCGKSCSHGSCKLSCSELCHPCTKEAPSTHCIHQDPALLCSIPGSRLPCSEPCQLYGPCGLHKCEGLCGEDCPNVCGICNKSTGPQPLFALPCSHIFEVRQLDELFGIHRIYKMEGLVATKVNITSLTSPSHLSCPTCKAPYVGAGRYALCREIHDHNNLLGELCSPVGNQLWRLMKFINHRQYELFKDINFMCQGIKSGPLTIRHNQDVLYETMAGLRDALLEAKRFRVEVRVVQDAILSYSSLLGVNSEAEDADKVAQPIWGIPNLPYLLRNDRVIIRCEFMIANFLYEIHKILRKRQDLDSHLLLFLDVIKAEVIAKMDGQIDRIDKLISQCQAMSLNRLEVEFIIQKVPVVVLARHLGQKTESMTTMLNRASKICEESQSAKQVGILVDLADRSIKENIVSMSLDDALNGPRQMKNYPSAHDTWARLAKFERGKLAMCSSGHYYCSSLFTYCPEC